MEPPWFDVCLWSLSETERLRALERVFPQDGQDAQDEGHPHLIRNAPVFCILIILPILLEKQEMQWVDSPPLNGPWKSAKNDFPPRIHH